MTARPLALPYNRDVQLVNVCPTSVLAFMVVMSLLLVQWIGTLAALVFLLSGLALVVRRPQTMLIEIRQYWMVLAIAFWCLLTVLWSNYGTITLRAAIQLLITFGIAISMANRLSPRAFLRMIFLSHLAVAVLSVLFGEIRSDGGGWIGIFGSKNALGSVMSLLVLAAFAVSIDKRQSMFWRLLGLVGLAAGSFILVQAQSSGALLTTIIAVMFGMLLLAARWMSPLQRIVVIGLGLIAALAAAILMYTLQDMLFDLLLETTGKDATLTGRTELWQRAFDEISLNPLFGQGFQAVWVVGNPVAEAMWAEFGIESKTGFHFHNTFISNAVEIGLIGVALQAAGLIGGGILTLLWALREPRADTIFLAIVMLRVLILSITEVVGYLQFDLSTVIALCALVFGIRAQRAYRMSQQPPRPTPVPLRPADPWPMAEDGSEPTPA